ncbi:MAG: ABC transporter ATP-binding protein [Candidatus Glassbacteria bacterium]|nr:ABC transporter ATP-binding protein [Candidatus Glassbacteria bacterium]
MIELENIEKIYRSEGVSTPVLKGVSFRVEAGEYVAVMGPSGSGKTTLMNILGCLDTPTGGRYLLDEIDMVKLDDDELSRVRNRKIGFVFQLFYLLERATTLKNVMLPLIYAEEYPADAEQRARNSLLEVGLGERMNYHPNTLSGGEQQRVAIARALINDPAIILADEPTGNLDSRSGIEVLSVFKRLHRQGRTIVVVTHDRFVAEHAGRIIQLKDGVVTEDKAVAEPRDPEAELQDPERREVAQ